MLSDYVYCPYDGLLLQPTKQSSGDVLGQCVRCRYIAYGNPRPCVGVFIYFADQLLLMERAQEPKKGKWDLVGGFIDRGETAEEAVHREVKQETKLDVTIIAYLGALPDVYDVRQFPTLNSIYLVRALSIEPLKENEEAEILRWYSVDSIPTDFAFAHQPQAVDLLRKYLTGHLYQAKSTSLELAT